MKKIKQDRFVVGDNNKVAIINAVSKISTLVGMTMGPLGRSVVIPSDTEYGKYTITKDGVSVAKVVKSENEYENVIINLVKEVAKDTVREAGDGTTTSTVLVGAFVEQLAKVNMTQELRAYFEDLLKQTIEHLDEVATPLEKKDIAKIASISANGDKLIAENIAKAYASSKVVHVKKSNKSEDTVEVINGLYVPTKSFIKLKEGYRKIEDVNVVVLNKNITSYDTIKPVIHSTVTSKKSLLVIADHCDQGVINNLTNVIKNNDLNVEVVKSPGFSSQRTHLLEDIAKYVTGKVVTEFDKTVEDVHYGYATYVEIDDDKIVISNKGANVKQLIKSLDVKVNKADTEHEKDLLNQRLDRLKGLSIIHVGGDSEVEVDEKFDRYEDAVLAVSCALSDGIVEGGGLTLAKYAVSKLKELGYNPKHQVDPGCLFYLALIKPYDVLVNSGLDYTFEEDLKEKDIYDPVKVTKTALIKSFNFAKVLMSTGAIILTKDE